MVAKISASNNLYGALSYNQIKVNDAQAKVIFTNRMIESADGICDINTCLRSFEPYILANNKTEKTVLHLSINPDPKDALSDEQLSEIAQKYMQKMGYGNQPFIVYKHEDIERKHIHIVSVKVDENGKKIDDGFEHRRSMNVCRELEKKYGLIPANQKKRQEELPLKPVCYENGNVKHQIANVICDVAKNYHFQSLKEYKALLALYNISAEEVRGEINNKSYAGLIYFALNEKGEKVGNPFKSSLFGKVAGIEALEKQIEKSVEIIKNKGFKERCKKIISATMHSCKNRNDFEKTLKKQGISVVFRINDEGRIYGVTFIDNEQKTVFNGSRLGKDFSANVFNNLFNGAEKINEKTQPKHNTGLPFETFENPSHEKEESSGIAGFFDFLLTENSGKNPDNDDFIKKMKRKKKKRKRL
ncbi:MAG: relaxase/mobilization nuclease domain-containing protein [Prevotellaceae bacterium]|jgi:hypothetical protein|nr:relaxase/mobilization nuclease domain-containing protein [Prevotellaceae bacterium]